MDSLLETVLHFYRLGGPLMGFMLFVSALVLFIGLERLLEVVRFRAQLRRLDERVVEAARRGEFEEARRLCEPMSSPLREVFASGLDRVLGRVRGDPAMAMAREQKRAMGSLKSWIWILGSAGALMPFVGLLGTVLGVMGAFKSIGLQEHGGFAVVSSGISEALIATATGLAVALEAVFLFNLLQNAVSVSARRLALLVDETLEMIRVRGTDHVDPTL
jgi:biopolymer transport protein ExbB/TolQ